MADPQTDDSPSDRERRLQEAFDRSAQGMNLRLEPASSCSEEGIRAVGVAFVCIHKIMDIELASSGGDNLTPAEDEAIARLLEGYESLDPESFARHWKEYAHDPHAGVGLSWVSVIDDEAVRRWLETPELREALDIYPPYHPRRVKLSNLNIVYISPSRAAATYRIEEEHTNGKLTAGNVVAVVMKVRDKGWRIVVASKGGRVDVSAGT